MGSGSARPGVGGEHDSALVARVSARAVNGEAAGAALAAAAGLFGVRRSAVRLMSGASGRTKVVGIDAGGPRVAARRTRLLMPVAGGGSRPARGHERSLHRTPAYGGQVGTRLRHVQCQRGSSSESA